MKAATLVTRLLVLLAVFGFTQFLFSQGTDLGTITGTVTDSTGAVVPNAKVVILDLATNTSREAKTNAQGVYRVFGLSGGKYQVTVSVTGMVTTQIKNVEVRGSDAVTADVQLKVASANEVVSVSAEAPLINTDNQTISDTITSTAVIDLPRDSRDIYSFLYLNPNITQGASDGAFKFLGAQSYGASFSLDGQRSNGGIFGEPTSSQPPLEAVGDINVLSNDFSAEYAGVGNVRVTTKRGGAGYHGSLLYNNKNSALAAWTLQDKLNREAGSPSNPYFNLNDISASFGGPIPKLKKTWFFAAYERNWAVSPVNLRTNNMPHPSLWGGDFSLVTNNAIKPLVPAGVVLTPQEIATDTVGGLGLQFNKIPSRLLSPYPQKLISTYFPKIDPSAAITGSTGLIPGYGTLMSNHGLRDLGTLRVDQDLTDNDHIYGVYSVSNQDGLPTGAFVQSPYTGLGLRQTVRRNDTLSVSYTRTFSPTVINEARAGFNHQRLRAHSNTILGSFLSSIGLDQNAIDAYSSVVGANELNTYGHTAILFSGGVKIANFASGGRNTDRPQDQDLLTFGDTFTWVLGKHTMKAGADFVRNAAIDGFAVNRKDPRGTMTYNGSGLNGWAKFLMGMAPTSAAYVNEARPPMDVYNWEHGYFFQDDWKVSSRLTLNLGLRYELVTPFIENNDLMANFDPNYVNPTTGQKGRFIIPSEKTLQYLDTRIIAMGVVTAAQSGLDIGRGLIRTDKNNFAPRLGIAYRLTDKTVLRGGYGFYYPTSAAQGIRDPIATNPFNQPVTKKGTGTPLQAWPNPMSGGVVTSGFGGLPSMNAVPVGLQQPRIQQYNVTFEREILRDTSLRVSYLGTSMSGLIAGVDLNAIKPSDVPFGTTTADGVTPCDPIGNADCDYSPADLARQRFPGLGDYLESYGNFGHGRSNAFQTQVEHRYTRGFMFNVAYTYLDQKSTGLDTGNSSLGGVAYNPFNPNHDYGQEGFISKNRFVAYGVFDLPFGRGKKFGSSFSRLTDAFLGGWQTSFNMFAKSGAGFTPFWLCDDCTTNEPGNIGVSSVDAVGDFNGPSFRPTVTGNPNRRVGDQIWDPTAFGLPPVGAGVFDDPSVAKRNILTGPGTWGANLGVHKDFRITERVTANLGVDIQNVFNHRLFSPDGDTGGGGGTFAMLGDFNVSVNPSTLKPQILPGDVNINPDFGRLINTFTQEGVDSRRTVRLRLRVTF